MLYLGVFGVADYESVIKIEKFKMADPIWRRLLPKKLAKNKEITEMVSNRDIRGF